MTKTEVQRNIVKFKQHFEMEITGNRGISVV